MSFEAKIFFKDKDILGFRLFFPIRLFESIVRQFKFEFITKHSE